MNHFRSLTLLDQGIFLITFDQFMNAPFKYELLVYYRHTHTHTHTKELY